MKKLTTLLLCLSGTTAFAQNTVVQAPSTAVQQQQNLWTPENLWIAICSVVIMGFIYLIFHALSSATVSLSKQVEKKANGNIK